MKQSPILSVKNLNVSIISKGIVSNIVNDLSFNVKRGEILSIVGESGSGKSMTAKAILRLLPQNSLVSGKVLFENDNLLDLNEKNVRKKRKKLFFPTSIFFFNTIFIFIWVICLFCTS